jgi:hypothetical protein
MYGLVVAMRERLRRHNDAVVVSYGHLNDGNLHLNVSVDSYRQEVLDCIEPFVYEYTKKHRGSISAEHGGSLSQQTKPYERFHIFFTHESRDSVDCANALGGVSSPDNPWSGTTACNRIVNWC